MDTSGQTTLACVAVLILETSFGVLASVYVITIILLDFYRKKNLRTGNKIRIVLSLSNFSLSIITSVSVSSGYFWPMISMSTSTNSMLYSFTMFCICSGSWLHACLSFFYFIKIVNVKTQCFIWVKTKISSIMSWVILVAEIVSFGSFFSVYFLTVPHPTSHNTSLSTHSAMTVSDLRSLFIHIVVVVTFLPLLAVLLTTITTAVVLKQHRLKMEKIMGPSGNVKLGTYKSTFFRMMRLLFFFIMFYTVMLIFYSPVFVENSPEFWLFLIIMHAFSPIQSITIALDDPKLKRVWKVLTKCVRSCKKQ